MSTASNTDETGPVRSNAKRSKSGCLTCRRRRVKCDETRPHCTRCVRTDRQCSFPPPYRWANQPPEGPSQNEIWEPSTSAVTLDHGHHVWPQVTVENAPMLVGGDEEGEEEALLLLPIEARLIAMSHPHFLAPYYPNLTERAVLHHYLHVTARAFTANPPDVSRNLWLESHMALAFSHPRGYSDASDAIQIALLAVGSTHLSYLSRAQANQAGENRAVVPANPLRDKAMSLTRRAQNSMTKLANIDLLLGALLCCGLATSLAGDTNWKEIFTTAGDLITQAGGIEQLIRQCPSGRVSTLRFTLEQFAIRDVFGCLSTGAAPAYLKVGFEPWFLEEDSRGRPLHKAMEEMFGLSRCVIDLMARVCTLVAERKSLTDTRAVDRFLESLVASDELPIRENDDFDDVLLVGRADVLLAEINLWHSTLLQQRQVAQRIHLGDKIHLYAIRIHLIANLYDRPLHQDQLVESCLAILFAAAEAVSTLDRIVWLTWPVLLAGMHLTADQTGLRQVTLKLLQDFANQGCYDSTCAITTMMDFWLKRDGGEIETWWDYIAVTGQTPFFD